MGGVAVHPVTRHRRTLGKPDKHHRLRPGRTPCRRNGLVKLFGRLLNRCPAKTLIGCRTSTVIKPVRTPSRLGNSSPQLRIIRVHGGVRAVHQHHRLLMLWRDPAIWVIYPLRYHWLILMLHAVLIRLRQRVEHWPLYLALNVTWLGTHQGRRHRHHYGRHDQYCRQNFCSCCTHKHRGTPLTIAGR